MAYSTTEFIAAVRREGRWASTDPYPLEADILGFADEELLHTVWPLLIRHRSEHGVWTTDVPLVADQQAYRLPDRAWGGVVRDAALLDDAGKLLTHMTLTPLEEIDAWAGQTANAPSVVRYAVQGDQVLMVPTPSTADATLRLRLYRRPSTLALPATADQIASGLTVGASTTSFTTAAATVLTAGQVVDVLENLPGYDTLAQSVTVNSASGTSVVLDGVLSLAVGAYVVPARTSVVVQLPAELVPSLVKLTAARIQRALREPVAADTRADGLAGIDAVTTTLVPRTQGHRTLLINRRSRVGRVRLRTLES